MKKRAFERIDSDVQLSFLYNDSRYSGIVNNLSENGLRIQTDNCLPHKSKFEVQFPVREEFVTLPAKVIRLIKSNDEVFAMGVELLNPSRKYMDFVSNLRWESSGKLSKRTNETSMYTCNMCGHIVFENLPLECPMCMASIENFECDPDALKRPEDPENLSDFEKQHIPIINVSRADELDPKTEYSVHVKVGALDHPLKIEDHITFIDYYIQASYIKRRCLGRMNLRCDKIKQEVKLYLNNVSSADLIVVSNCVAHGSWMSRVKI